GSINARAPESRGCPGELSTSFTIGGAEEPTAATGLACCVRRCRASWFLRHSSHSPLELEVPPQLHFRCSRRGRARFDERFIATLCWSCWRMVTVLALEW